MKDRTVFRKIFDGFLDSIGILDDGDDFELIPRKKIEQKTRSTSMGRVYEQVRSALYSLDDWAYPLDIYVGDDGSSLFSIVAQSGKLYQVPLTVSEDTVALGDWIQVKEEFSPVQQTFSVKRQKDGTHRWFCVAATSVLNRVGEIDSCDLFDSFIKRAEETGEYPRLDFYHLGLSDPEKWEFGTADYLARDGVCYIASGVFDEDHPLAKATIRACAAEPGVWGNSIEFYAFSEPEIVVADPEVKVPVYKDGKNTRISVVLEKDAAGLFTRIGVNQEIKRTMDKKTKEVLQKLFGDDQEAFDTFVENSDAVNRTVKDDKLIHRTTEESAEEESVETEDTSEDADELVLDDAAVAAITQQMTESAWAKSITQSLDAIKQLVAESVVGREKTDQEIAKLKETQGKIVQTIERLNKDEGEKKQEYLTDLPSRQQRKATYRPSEIHDIDEFEEDLGKIAERTLNGIPGAY